VSLSAAAEGSAYKPRAAGSLQMWGSLYGVFFALSWTF
jgi:hypothetical protein